MDGSGFNVVPDDLRSAGSSIAGALRGADGFTLDSSGASAYGHDALGLTVADFCSTVRHAVHGFAQDAGTAGEALGIAARDYAETDSSAGQTITQSSGGL